MTTTDGGNWTIEQLDADGTVAAVPELAAVLIDCVEGGASVSFMWPLAVEKAEAFWRGVADGVRRGERAILVARDAAGTIGGTVHLVLAQPENQPHRADVTKLLVHRNARRAGLGARLMSEVERLALDFGKTLLVLDTASGEARRVYERLGWSLVGRVPDYALSPDGTRCDTWIYYKSLTN